MRGRQLRSCPHIRPVKCVTVAPQSRSYALGVMGSRLCLLKRQQDRPPSDAFGARRALDQKETFHLSIHTTSGCPPSDPTSRHVAILIAQRLPPRRRRPLMWHFEWGFIESGFIGKKNIQHRLVQKLNSNQGKSLKNANPPAPWRPAIVCPVRVATDWFIFNGKR